MPYLRFVRDKRGYENTYVMHAARRHGSGRQRILYWFRTPPGVKVGRAALDEDAVRAIEDSNPNLMFDWPKMLKVQSSTLAPAARREGGKPRRGGREGRRPVQTAPVPAKRPTDLELEVPEGAVQESASLRVAESAEASGVTAEDLARLKGRHAEIMARIAERVSDPARKEMLRAEAETLNPDTWVTSEEVAQGVAEFEKRYEDLRRKLGRRRRRSRRGGRRRRGRGASQGLAISAGVQSTGPEAAAGGSQEPDEKKPEEEV